MKPTQMCLSDGCVPHHVESSLSPAAGTAAVKWHTSGVHGFWVRGINGVDLKFEGQPPNKPQEDNHGTTHT